MFVNNLFSEHNPAVQNRFVADKMKFFGCCFFVFLLFVCFCFSLPRIAQSLSLFLSLVFVPPRGSSATSLPTFSYGRAGWLQRNIKMNRFAQLPSCRGLLGKQDSLSHSLSLTQSLIFSSSAFRRLFAVIFFLFRKSETKFTWTMGMKLNEFEAEPECFCRVEADMHGLKKLLFLFPIF